MNLNDEAPSNAAHWHKMATEAQAEVRRLREAIGEAYGYLWCVNNEPGTPHQYPPERAAYEARKLTDRQIADMAFTVLREHNDNRLWRALTKHEQHTKATRRWASARCDS